MGSVVCGGTAVAVLQAPDVLSTRMDVCVARNEVITLKSRTVWFPVLHGRGFL